MSTSSSTPPIATWNRAPGFAAPFTARPGPSWPRECRRIGYCATGEAVITGSYDLACRAVVHTPGPVYGSGAGDEEEELLASCYLESMRLCAQGGFSSIAFPAISTGVYRFPIQLAAQVAVAAVREGLEEHPEITRVHLVCFSMDDRDVYAQALAEAV
jgi:O-acetyl-ADP-ribose deacetylase (regulator of RNase III)